MVSVWLFQGREGGRRGRAEVGIWWKGLHTSSNHFRAFGGRLYCFAFSLRSSTKEGKRASNFFFASWDNMMVEPGSQVPMILVRMVDGRRGMLELHQGEVDNMDPSMARRVRL